MFENDLGMNIQSLNGEGHNFHDNTEQNTK